MATSLHPLARYQCLVIDDFQGMRSMLRDMLRECGAKDIEMAASGKEAISLLAERKFDIVLCDYNLGAGRNGQQVLEEAKLRNLIGPACTWIMITAEKSADWIMGAVEYQPDAYLIKPITTELLLNRLERIAAKKRAFADIDQAIVNKQFLRAIALCDDRLKTDAANAAELQRIKGQLLLSAGNLDAARTLFEQVLAARELAWARTGLGRVCYERGDYTAARDHLTQVIAAQRTYLEAYDWLARAQQALGDDEAAEAVLADALKLSPNSPQRQKNLGQLAMKRGDLAIADAAFRKSILVGEHSILKTPDAYIGLAKVCSASDNNAEALKVLGAVQRQFDSDDVKLRAKSAEGLIYKQEHQLAKANTLAAEVDELLKGGGGQPDDAASIEAAELLLATGRKDSAVRLLQQVVKNNHENQGLIAQVQTVFDSAGMRQEGAQLVEGSRREALDLMNRGVLLARDGKLSEAIDAMRAASTALPNNARVLLNFASVAVLYLQREGPDRALVAESRQALLRANQLSPGEKRFAQLMDALALLA
ncbi:tetratricopeptide repeat-containing response regulator [Chitinolyticbacter meiyuanensis]|uniref:tetratricopeptide repeat-containing response regulator n=1 Tax=Chitinolyticbacter meiyuanensis TaxID=682798 RepID=UPI0011E58BD7|nr:tetratricopeptide repeat-containing response regulator [Chitinolyticbacter meiyuanensis]